MSDDKRCDDDDTNAKVKKPASDVSSDYFAFLARPGPDDVETRPDPVADDDLSLDFFRLLAFVTPRTTGLS